MRMLGIGLWLGSVTVAFAGGCTDSTGVVCPPGALGCGDAAPASSGGGTPAVVPDASDSTSQGGPPASDSGGAPAPEAAVPSTLTPEAAAPEPANPDDGADNFPDAATMGVDSGAQGPNLVTDGDFSQPNSPLWAIVAGAGTITVTNGELCVAVAAGGQATLGWPQPAGSPGAVLASGASYTFSYKARAMQAVTVDAKVGQSNPPYSADFDSASDSVTTGVQTMTHTFVASQGDSSAGIAFAFTAGPTANQVCFQSVDLSAD